MVFHSAQAGRLKALLCATLALAWLQPVVAEDVTALATPKQKFDWKPAVTQAFYFLVIQHSFRFAAEQQTRAGLKGPFFKDYARSVQNLHGWSDGDTFLANYVGHPLMGSVSGFIEVQNDPQYMRVPFGLSRSYWISRLRALAFMAAYSEQFEIGPISEASLGNVQLVPKARGFVDHVVTPTVGLVWLAGEDALDRLVVGRVERGKHGRLLIAVLRSGLNPGRSLANVLRMKKPWYRDGRGGLPTQTP